VTAEEGDRTAADRGVDTAEGVAQKDIEWFRYYVLVGVEEGTEAELGLVRHCLHLVEYHELTLNPWPPRTYKIEDSLADDLNGTLIAGIQIEGAENG